MNKRIGTAVAVVVALSGVTVVAQQAGPAANGEGGAASRTVAGPNGLPPLQQPTMQEWVRRNGGALSGSATMFVPPDSTRSGVAAVSSFAVAAPEPKVIKKHDLITVIIREETSVANDAQTDLKKNADFNAQLEQMIKVSLKNSSIQGGGQGAVPPSIKLGGARNFKGEAKNDRTDSFMSRIAAKVVDVKPNGTFAIQAHKLIKSDEEEQDYVMTGVCRAADVTPDNTVMSWQIDDARITVLRKGAVTDTTKRGWVPKIIDAINPF